MLCHSIGDVSLELRVRYATTALSDRDLAKFASVDYFLKFARPNAEDFLGLASLQKQGSVLGNMLFHTPQRTAKPVGGVDIITILW